MPEMKQFEVSVQGQVYKTIEAQNTGAALALIARDVAAGVVPDFDPDQPHNIVITPVNE